MTNSNSSGTYRSICQPSSALTKEKGSKFFAYAYPIPVGEDVTPFLDLVREQHPKASHHCYAWRKGLQDNNYRANDDGEPSGTAGRPILGQIDKLGLTQVIVIVVRYFGGTKLGTSGLIQAYKQAAQDALEAADVITNRIHDEAIISCSYDIYNQVEKAIADLNIKVKSRSLTSTCIIILHIPRNEKTSVLLALKCKITSDYAENVTDKWAFENFSIELNNFTFE